MSVSDLPTLNATLNGLAFLFLVTGFMFIRRKKVAQHRAMMLAAFITSGLFLVSYLAYHFSSHLITRYEGEGLMRTVYFAILISHSVLAVAVPPMAFVTLFRGLRMNVEKHRRIARWTLPIWMYVSVTGVVIYVMLYQLPA
ncbi:MAG: DUF420 domain-containing protein [Bacteroidetes bacterium]|nr:DUF420 domain-containing protein [Bacteroidota bacterium]